MAKAIKIKEVITEEGASAPQSEQLIVSNTVGASAIVLTPSSEVVEDPRLVKVKISYPKDFKGTKHLVDGQTYSVSPESAEILIKKGIASK